MSDKWIQRFQEEALPLISKEIKPSRVLIFGSRIKGSATEESDIDFKGF
ncbi:MAG: hypothetical protein Kow0099_07380 [Candidatus Abyssubacteria bacterium]